MTTSFQECYEYEYPDQRLIFKNKEYAFVFDSNIWKAHFLIGFNSYGCAFQYDRSDFASAAGMKGHMCLYHLYILLQLTKVKVMTAICPVLNKYK